MVADIRQPTTGYVHPTDPNLLNIHKAMEFNAQGQPVLRVAGLGGGGTMDLTALSVYTDVPIGGGSLTYDNTTGIFLYNPADLTNINLGNFVITGTNLQTLSGTINGADIVLDPNGGAVQVPSLKIGIGGNIVNTSLYIEAFITTYELVSIVAHSNTVALDTGVYGNINGVPAPWTVFELSSGVSGTSISAIQINDILTGAGIIPSTVGDRGSGLYANYVIVNLDLEGLGQILPITGAVFNLTRPLNKAALNVQGSTNTDIFLDSQGLGDIIVNTNILPITTNISNLGSPTKRWKSIYVGPGTIYVLDETLGKDIAIGARDGLLYVQNGAGLTVGEFTLIDNQIKIANPARDMIIGTTGATANVVFNRAIKVKDSTGALAFEVDRTGLTSIYTPGGADPNKATLSIIGTANGHQQPRGTLYDGTLLQLTAQDGKSSRISSDSFGTGVYPLYAARAARGTVDSPQPIISGDVLSRFSSVGYGDSKYMTGIARIDALAAENFSDSTAGTKFSFQTTPVGSTASQLSAIVNSTGISFVGATDTAAGITFRNSDRLTYFPTPAGQTNKWLKSNGTTMSWQVLPVLENPIVYKGAWNAYTNHPPLTQTTANDQPAVSGYEYSIEATGTQNLGDGSQTYEQGGFVIYNGSSWEYIPPINGVASIRFDSGDVYTGAVLVQSFDIVNTLATNSLGNDKLAHSSVTVTAGTGLSGGGTAALGGTITVSNAGVLSITSNSGLSVNTNATGNVTITNTGVLSVTGNNHISASVVSGDVTVTSDATINATNNTIALRDSAGGLIAKDFTATLDASISSDHGPFNYGTLSYADTGIMADFSYSINSYNQVVLQNRNSGNSASSNYIVSNNLGTTSTYYGEFGMNSSGFSGSGSLALPSAVYLNAISSDLVIGGSTIRFVINNGSTDALSVNALGVLTAANTIQGNISGQAGTVGHSVTFAATGGSSANSAFNGGSTLIVDYHTVGAQVAGTYVTSVSGTAGRTTSTGITSVIVDLVASGVGSGGTVGSSSVIPIITYDTYGRITGITTASNSQGTITQITVSQSTINGLGLSGGTINNTGTIALTGTLSGITNSNLSGSAGITNNNLSTPTISGVQLGNNLYNLTAGNNITFSTGTTYNGSTAVTINSVASGVTSITAGTGTAISTSTGAVTIWTVPQTITSTATTTASNYTIDLSGPTFIAWQPSANGNRTVTLTGFTPGRKVQVFITPHRAQDIFTFTGVTASQCSNGVNTFILGGGGVAQISMMIEIFCTTNAIGGVWIFGYGSQ